MTSLLLKYLPFKVIRAVHYIKTLVQWFIKGFTGASPQFIKQNIFKEYNSHGSTWIETGTYLGITADFLSRLGNSVHSIEPDEKLFKLAQSRLKSRNLSIHFGTSEILLESLLKQLSGPLIFWLDGHYSEGITYKGKTISPIKEELNAIQKNLDRVDALTILIDDVRIFAASNGYENDYPNLDYLVDWARQNKMRWHIEHDIFIMKNSPL